MKICNNISCMKQILSTHNPKVVSSNLAPATKKSAENTSFSALYFLLFYRKIDFDPNLTPKHQKRKVEQDNTSCSISFID
mgnify:CR=1 FL=1